MRTFVAVAALLVTLGGYFAVPAAASDVFVLLCDLSINDGYPNRCFPGSANTGVDCCAQGYTRCADVIQCASNRGLRVSSAAPVFQNAFAVLYTLTKK